MATKEFSTLIKKIKEEDKKIYLTPKELLNYFNYEKRTRWNTWIIDKFLVDNHLEVIPDYKAVYMYSEVILKSKEKARIKKSKEDIPVFADPINRINMLPSSNSKPISIKRDAKLTEAITLMMLHDYSQLPVMNNERDVDGLITWKSIGQCLIHKKEGDKVKDYMSKHFDIINYDTPLFDAIKLTIDKEIVLVKKTDNTICGLITTSDINQHYLALTEPFLLLKEIENHIRIILDGKFTLEELKSFASSPDNNKEINSISDLTFGEYIRLMENGEKWEKLKLTIDKKTFTERLDQVRRIRNDVMHFHPDGISPNDEEVLRDTSKFFSRLSELV